jgi:hypothetical protein
MQSLVYETQHNLVARIAVAAGTLREMPGSFKDFSITWQGGTEHVASL